MFVHLTLGTAADSGGLRQQWGRWHDDVAPGSAGWLRSVAGVTGDGRAVLCHFFDSVEAAGASSERPEHAAWWSGTETCLGLPLVSLETGDVHVEAPHEAAGAGFVQVMRATVQDRARFERVEEEIGPLFMEARPDFLTGYRAWFPDGSLAAIDFFRSEAEARAGESAPMPDRLREGFQEWLGLLTATEWYDLAEPWHAAPVPLGRQEGSTTNG